MRSGQVKLRARNSVDHEPVAMALSSARLLSGKVRSGRLTPARRAAHDVGTILTLSREARRIRAHRVVDQLAANLWGFFFAAAAPDEPQTYFAYAPAINNTCIRLLLPDHTNARLTRLRNDLGAFVRDRVTVDPALNQIKVRYLGGEGGLYLATDDVMARLNWVN